MKKEELKEMLEKQGIEAEKMAEILKEFDEKEQKERETLENTMSVREVAQYLDDNLTDDWNEPKVRRFITSGDIKPMVTPGSAKKLGYKIEKDEVDRFIKEYSMTKDDWKKYAKQLEKRIQELEAKLDSPSTSEDVPNVSERSEALQETAEVSEVSKEGQEVKTAKKGQSRKPVSKPKKEITVNYPKIIKSINNDDLFEIGFKMDGESWIGTLSVLQLDIEKAMVLSVESENTSKNYARATSEAMIEAIEKAFLPKVKAKLQKAIDNVKKQKEK